MANLKIIAIQQVWIKEDNIKIVLIFDTNIINTLIILIEVMVIIVFVKFIEGLQIIRIGVTFCQVMIIRLLAHEKTPPTRMIHGVNGNIPIFRNIDTNIMVGLILLFCSDLL